MEEFSKFAQSDADLAKYFYIDLPDDNSIVLNLIKFKTIELLHDDPLYDRLMMPQRLN